MTNIILFLCGVAVVFAFATALYRGLNHGLSSSAKHQQRYRFLISTALAVLPTALCGLEALSPSLLFAVLVAAVWMTTYPLLFHLTNRKSAPDYDNYGDINFGLYLIAWLSALHIAAGYFFAASIVAAVVLSIVLFLLLFIPFAQIVYYLIYDTCIDVNGMKIVQETNYNEILEYPKSFPLATNIAVAVGILTVIGACMAVEICFPTTVVHEGINLFVAIFCSLFALAISPYMWKRRGLFARTGVARLYLLIKEYAETNQRYTSERDSRMASLEVEALGEPGEKPSTIVMVIGESGARDYMSAFREQDRETTPWLSSCKKDDRHFILFPHSYSCTMHTVPVLENALTERNQYNDKPFYTSCSVVDIAQKLGYNVHWYSNQGHLGESDTPTTLVANTSDVAKWTKQELNKLQYDQSLVDFLDEVDPTKNNFVVFHLIGSHFNFINRYPPEYTQWGKAGVQDDVLNFKNSLHYTDHVLQQFFEYGRDKLNMQAMLYFSDHATMPDRKRSPKFDGFGHTRIPMFAYLSDDYIRLHGSRYEALRKNKDKYFTNDLVYDLMCGIFDIRSNRFDESCSLASADYRFTRDTLLTFEGKIHISEDTDE